MPDWTQRRIKLPAPQPAVVEARVGRMSYGNKNAHSVTSAQRSYRRMAPALGSISPQIRLFEAGNKFLRVQVRRDVFQRTSPSSSEIHRDLRQARTFLRLHLRPLPAITPAPAADPPCQ